MGNKIWLVIGALVLVIGGAAVFAVATSNRQPGTAPSPAAETKQENSSQNQTSAPQAAGAYTGYDAAKAASAQGRKVLFFHAPWCPQCRALDASIKEKGVPEGMTIFKVDYDSSSDLKQRYGVTIQTTLVEIGPDGSVIKKHVAYDEPSLPAVLMALGQ